MLGKLLADKLPELSVGGIAAGLHLVLSLPPDVDPELVVAAGAQKSVRTANLVDSFDEPHRSPPGLVLGHGNLADASVHEAVSRLAAAYSLVAALA